MFLAFDGPTPMLTMVTPALQVRSGQVVRGHLEPLPRRGGNPVHCFGRVIAAPNHHATRGGQPVVRACRVRQFGQPPLDELVDVTLVIGQQNPRLDAAPVAAGIVQQAPQRVIHTHRVEQCQRQRLAGIGGPKPVRHLIAHSGQQGGRKMPRQVGRRRRTLSELVAAVQDVRVRHLLFARRHPDRGTILRRQRTQLIKQIGPEKARLGNGGGIDTRGLESPPGTARNRDRPAGLPGHPQFRIAKAAALLRKRWCTIGCKARQGVALRLHRLGVQRLQPVDRLVGRQCNVVSVGHVVGASRGNRFIPLTEVPPRGVVGDGPRSVVTAWQWRREADSHS